MRERHEVVSGLRPNRAPQADGRQAAAHAIRPQVREARPPDRTTRVAAIGLVGRREGGRAGNAADGPGATQKIAAQAAAGAPAARRESPRTGT